MFTLFCTHTYIYLQALYISHKQKLNYCSSSEIFAIRKMLLSTESKKLYFILLNLSTYVSFLWQPNARLVVKDDSLTAINTGNNNTNPWVKICCKLVFSWRHLPSLGHLLSCLVSECDLFSSIYYSHQCHVRSLLSNKVLTQICWKHSQTAFLFQYESH